MEVNQIPPPYRHKKKLNTFADWSSAPNPTYTFKETHQETLPTISPKVQPWSSPTAQIYAHPPQPLRRRRTGTMNQPERSREMPFTFQSSRTRAAQQEREWTGLIDSSAPAHLPRSLVCECEGNILLGG
jgi:hypothetical protein